MAEESGASAKPKPDPYSLMKRLERATADGDTELMDVILLAQLGCATTTLFSVAMVEHIANHREWLGANILGAAAATLETLHHMPDHYWE